MWAFDGWGGSGPGPLSSNDYFTIDIVNSFGDELFTEDYLIES